MDKRKYIEEKPESDIDNLSFQKSGKKDFKITPEELDTFENFKDLSPGQKSAVISFVHELSLVLYNYYYQSEDGKNQ